MPRETVAIIDLGTNTFQLMMVRVDELGRTRDVKRTATPVRLGEGGMNAGHIAPAAFKRGIEALMSFRKLMDKAGATTTVAVATSALRGASNSADFLAAAQRETGIAIRIIDGVEEAGIIHDGIVSRLHLPIHQPVLLMDIGGGSVEFIVSKAKNPLFVRSLNIGAARLAEYVAPSNPLTAEELKKLQLHLMAAMEPMAQEIRPYGVRKLIGSSSTFKALGTLISHRHGQPLIKDALQGFTFGRDDFAWVYETLMTSTHAERLAMYEMGPLRADMIVPAVEVVHAALSLIPTLDEIVVSNYALREGILVRYLKTWKQAANP